LNENENEKKFKKEKRFQTPPSKEKENSDSKILHDILISTKNSQNKSFAKEFVLKKAKNLKIEDFSSNFKRNEDFSSNFKKNEDLSSNKILEEKKGDIYVHERDFLKKENEFLKNNLTNLLSEHHLLKETNVQLNNHIDELRQNIEKLGKKYKDKKDYNKKLLDLLKIQGKFKIIYHYFCKKK